jgi:hypothetical protein
LNKRSHHALAFLPVVVLALILTLLVSGGDHARAMLQTSPFESPIQPLATLTLSPPDIGQPPGQVFPTLAPPTAVPLPATVGPTPTALGFLPAPTIVNPNDLESLPLAQPAPSGSGQGAEPASSATPQPGDTIVRAAVTLLNYLWLACGGVLLVGGAVAIVLIWRRGRQA